MKIIYVSFFTLLLQTNNFADFITSKTDLQNFDYYVSGIYEDDGNVEYNFYGLMTIKQIEIVNFERQVYFDNEISKYSIIVDNIGCKSGKGYFSSVWYDYGDESFTCGFDAFALTGDLSLWLETFNVNFYDENMNLYSKYGSPADYYKLPYIIELSNTSVVGPSGFLKYMKFEKVNTVAECSPLILLLLGIFVLLLLYKSSRILDKL